MDGIYPHGKDFQSCRPIRSQTLYPLSYGCAVERLYLFRGEKSRNASGAMLFGEFLKPSWCNPGAIKEKMGQISGYLAKNRLDLPSKGMKTGVFFGWRLISTQAGSVGH